MENTPTKRTQRFRRPTGSSLPTRPVQQNVDTEFPTPPSRRSGQSLGLPALASKAPAEIVPAGYVSKLAAPPVSNQAGKLQAPLPSRRVDTVAKPVVLTPTEKLQAPHSPKTTDTLTKPKAKRDRRKIGRITETDMLIIRLCYEHGQMTLPHIARAIGSITDNCKVRVTALANAGFLGVVKNPVMNRYYAKRNGLEVVGIVNGRVYDNVAESTVAHTNQLNTTMTGLRLGDEFYNELTGKETERINKGIASQNIRWEADNQLLVMKQNQLRQKASLTTAEQSLLNRKPKGMAQSLEVSPPVSFSPWNPAPKLTIIERTIRIHEQDKGDVACRMDWGKDMEAFLNLDGFPYRWASNPDEQPMSQAENDVVEEYLKTFADSQAGYMFKHWNERHAAMDGSFTTYDNFGKRHSFDGIVPQPHLVSDDQKTITGGSWAIEQELHKKPAMEYKRIILMAVNHPLIGKLIYYVTDTQIKTRIHQGMNMAIKDLAAADTDPRKGYEQKLAEATALVKPMLIIRRRILLNSRTSETGYCG